MPVEPNKSNASPDELHEIMGRLLPSTFVEVAEPVEVTHPDACPYPSHMRQCAVCLEDGGQFALNHLRRRLRVHYRSAACLEVVRQTKARDLGQELLERSGLEPAEFRHTFEAAERTAYNSDLIQELMAWTPASGRSYYITRPDEGHRHYCADNPLGNGTGKSYLLHALTVAWCKAGLPCRFVVAPDILTAIRSTFSREQRGEGDSEGSVLAEYQRAPLLLIDDFGMEAVKSDWAAEKVFQIVNARVRAELPTVYSSNIPLHELEYQFDSAHGKAIASRIIGSAAAWALGGPDRRWQTGEKTRQPARSWAERY